MRFGFFLREALRALRRNAVPSFAAMATVLVTVLVLGVFIPVVQATTGAANDVREKVLVDVYLADDATQTDISRVERLIRGTEGVGDVQFISRADALKRERAAGRVRVHVEPGPRPSTIALAPRRARRATSTGPRSTSRDCACSTTGRRATCRPGSTSRSGRSSGSPSSRPCRRGS